MTNQAKAISLMDKLKRIVFPGINLHARDRFRRIPAELTPASNRNRLLLDAGFGNGMLALQAWRAGYRVVGVSLKKKEVEGARRMFHDQMNIPETEMCFLKHNLYDTAGLRDRYGSFDEIVCAEVIEHIRDDLGICAAFYDLLAPGGVLHLTTPNANHPYNDSFPLDLHERGGHVRPGYTRDSLLELLLPLGFELEKFYEFGGAVRQAFNWRIKEIQRRFGPWAGVPLFLLAVPFLAFDRPPPKVGFSVYLRARKPAR